MSSTAAAKTWDIFKRFLHLQKNGMAHFKVVSCESFPVFSSLRIDTAALPNVTHTLK